MRKLMSARRAAMSQASIRGPYGPRSHSLAAARSSVRASRDRPSGSRLAFHEDDMPSVRAKLVDFAREPLAQAAAAAPAQLERTDTHLAHDSDGQHAQPVLVHREQLLAAAVVAARAGPLVGHRRVATAA